MKVRLEAEPKTRSNVCEALRERFFWGNPKGRKQDSRRHSWVRMTGSVQGALHHRTHPLSVSHWLQPFPWMYRRKT